MGKYGRLGSLALLGLAAGGFYYGLSDSASAGSNYDSYSADNVGEYGAELFGIDERANGPCDRNRRDGFAYTADEEGGRPGPPPPRDDRSGPPRGRGEGPPPHRPPMAPIERVLDANKDGVISSEEMEKASERLKKLDINEDGELTEDEFAPPPPPPPPMHPPGAGPGGERPPPRHPEPGYGPPGDHPPGERPGPPPPRRGDRPPPREETGYYSVPTSWHW